MASQTVTSTTKPKVPQAALSQLYAQEADQTPEHFMTPEQRQNLAARMMTNSELSAKNEDTAAANRAGGDTSSQQFQRNSAIAEGSRAAGTAGSIANVDTQDLQMGEQRRQNRLNALYRIMALRTGQQTKTTSPLPKTGTNWGQLAGQIGGAAIGTAIAPGVGTSIGASLGGAAGGSLSSVNNSSGNIFGGGTSKTYNAGANFDTNIPVSADNYTGY